jgi:hypothetical protein
VECVEEVHETISGDVIKYLTARKEYCQKKTLAITLMLKKIK